MSIFFDIQPDNWHGALIDLYEEDPFDPIDPDPIGHPMAIDDEEAAQEWEEVVAFDDAMNDEEWQWILANMPQDRKGSRSIDPLDDRPLKKRRLINKQ